MTLSTAPLRDAILKVRGEVTRQGSGGIGGGTDVGGQVAGASVRGVIGPRFARLSGRSEESCIRRIQRIIDGQTKRIDPVSADFIAAALGMHPCDIWGYEWTGAA